MNLDRGIHGFSYPTGRFNLRDQIGNNDHDIDVDDDIWDNKSFAFRI